MKESIKLPSNRNFGLVFSIFFLIISFYPLIFQKNLNKWALILSITFLILGLMNSNLLSPLNKVWFKFGIILGKIISPIVLFLIFFLVMTPISIYLKLIKKDILKLKKNNENTYWIPKEKSNSTMKDQF